MEVKQVDADSLASILYTNRQIERLPEPFRGQPHVTLLVDFEDYIRFVTSALGRVGYLYTSASELTTLTSMYRREQSETTRMKLWSAFLKDMAMALLKEVWWAERLGKGATTITQMEILEGITFSAEDIVHIYASAGHERQKVALEWLAGKGYEYPPQVSARNSFLFKLAVTTFHLSDSDLLWSYR